VSYRRFVSPTAPANVAKAAKVGADPPRSLAGLASLAGVHAENSVQIVASVATVARFDAPCPAVLRNDPALYELQADPNRCHFCGKREAPEDLFIAVLTPLPDHRHWLHRACHPEHVARMAAKAEAMAAATHLRELRQ